MSSWEMSHERSIGCFLPSQIHDFSPVSLLNTNLNDRFFFLVGSQTTNNFFRVSSFLRMKELCVTWEAKLRNKFGDLCFLVRVMGVMGLVCFRLQGKQGETC